MCSVSVMGRCQQMSLVVLVTMMLAMLVVAVADESSRMQSQHTEHILRRGLTSLEQRRQERSKNEPVLRRVSSTDTKKNSGKFRRKKDEKDDERKNSRRRERKLKIKNKNTPRKNIPAYIRRVMPLITEPTRRRIIKSKEMKKDTCGRTYEVKNRQKFRFRLSERKFCNIIFRAAKGSAMKLSCRRIFVGNCNQGKLLLTDGAALRNTYCGEPTFAKVKVKKVTEVLLSYTPSKSTEVKLINPDVRCIVRGKKGKGYSAAGKQQCPLSCGKATADAEAAKKPQNPTITTSSSLIPAAASYTPATLTTVPTVTTNLTTTIESISSQMNTSLINMSAVRLPLIKTKRKSGDSETKGPNTIRVQGGKDADKGEWPWIVYVKVILGGSVLPCGGTIISPRYILTAGHCVYDVNMSKGDKIKVVAYEYNIKQKDETPRQIGTVTTIHLHPSYDSSTQNADIAVLELKKPLTFGPGVAPICIAPKRNYKGSDVIVLGWGSLSYTGDDPDVLQEATQKVDNINECSKNYSSLPHSMSDYPITKHHVCTSAPGVDSCLGDSGGPIIVQIGTSWYQLGIVSFGHKCAVPGFPGVNTRVPSYIKWIYKIIRKDTCN